MFVLLVPEGTRVTWWNGDGVSCVSRSACVLSTAPAGPLCVMARRFTSVCDLSMVTVSLWTASRTPSLTSLSTDAFTCCYQCEATAMAFVSGSTWCFNSRPSIRGSVWFSQVLKVLDRYLLVSSSGKRYVWRQLIGMIKQLIMVAAWYEWDWSSLAPHRVSLLQLNWLTDVAEWLIRSVESRSGWFPMVYRLPDSSLHLLSCRSQSKLVSNTLPDPTFWAVVR